MITAHQAEVIAFITDGDIICLDCAKLAYGEDSVALAEEGLYSEADISPLIRYSLDEYVGESNWEYARERVGEFLDRHPAIAESPLLDDGPGELIDRVFTRRYADLGYPCGNCGEEIT